MSDNPFEHWTVLEEEELLRLGARLMVTRQRIRLPDGREVADYVRFVSQPAVCIFALTGEGAVICERQYKHGPGRTVLTLPAGSCEEGEETLDAARRELLEETGHTSDHWQCLGEIVTHANAGGGHFHIFLARDCCKVAEPCSGDLEEMRIETLELPALLQAMADGEMPLASDAAAILRALQALGWLAPQTP